MGLPALAFTLWQGLRLVRLRIMEGGKLAVSGFIGERQAMPLFVVLSYVGLWLPWATQPRIMFIYHYLPAVGFLVLALSYTINWLWHYPRRYARWIAVMYLALVAVTFAYFYPHWAAVDVPKWLDDSYYWFKSWQ
jgi:dolichyl-phosphate-mannose--protein O-mannosyl transferase